VDLKIHFDGLIALLKIVFWVTIIFGGIPGAFWVYGAIDQAGWIPHSAQLQVNFPRQSWEVGEYVDCYATRVDETSPVILDCEGGEPSSVYRDMDVTLWGKAAPGKNGIPFKCQRNEDSITCHVDNSQSGSTSAP
jgi:hypothetical protein